MRIDEVILSIWWRASSVNRAVSAEKIQRRVEFGLEFGVLGTQLLEFGEEFTNHRLERDDIGRQRRIGGKRGGVHAL